MDNQPTENLSICQVCKEKPAVYGDGLTWSRCSECERKFREKTENPMPEVAPSPTTEAFSHKLVQGLVSIIMPVYNVNYPLFHYTGTAIGAVRAHSKKGDYELIVVDNASPVQPPSPNAYYCDKYVINEKNEGVTKAWNQGIRVSFGEYIVLLNTDTQVYEGWLEDMKKSLDAGLDLVMATPMYSLTEPFARWVEAEKIRDQWAGKPVQESFSDFKDFACVMFKKDLFDKLDDGILFDETFFNYCSDVDLLKRMDAKGLKYASTKTVAIHHIIDATGASVPETPEIMNEDKAKFAEKWDKPKTATEIAVTPEQLAKIQHRIEETNPVFKGGENMDIKDIPTEQLEAELERRKNLPLEPVKRTDIVNTDFTGDKVFLLKDGETHWIKNPEVLKALGAGFDDVQKLGKEEFNKYLKGEDLDMANVERYANEKV